MYYNARDYDPALGTFVSPDSMVPGAGQVINYNRFLYARGNPLKYSDPSGYIPVKPTGPPVKAVLGRKNSTGKTAGMRPVGGRTIQGQTIGTDQFQIDLPTCRYGQNM